jgi:GTPase SAR1 family protein
VSPVLLLVGPASSGKTTFMRSISELLFGRDLSVVRMPGDDKMFDAVIGKRSFICLDGVTEWSDWLDERLEGIARKESIFVRRGQDYVEKRLDCSMAITTRHFPDEGLQCVNRLLPIMLKRPERNVPERTIIDGIRCNRDVIMTQLLVRLQRLLIDLGLPLSPGYSGSYMSADFADIAFRVARSIGFNAQVTEAFERLSSLHEAVLSGGQQVVELLNLWVAMPGNEGREVKAAVLHKELAVIAEERGKTIMLGERPFAHWLSKSIKRLRQMFSIEKIKARSNQRFYSFRSMTSDKKDMECAP